MGSLLVLDWCFLLLGNNLRMWQTRLMTIDTYLELVTVQAPRVLTYGIFVA